MNSNLKTKILDRVEQVRNDLLDLKIERNSYGEWIDVDINNDIELSMLLLEYETKVLLKLLEENNQ